MKRKDMFLAVVLIAIAAIMAPTAAMALTEACTGITNQATLSYFVGSTAQADISNTPGGTDAFQVGNKVNLTVATVDVAATTVTPNAAAADLITAGKVLEFTVTNDGNARQDYSLAALAKVNGAWTVFGGPLTDNFNLSGVSVFVDVNGNGTYESGTDTATSINDLGPGQSKTVFIVPTGTPAVASSRANNDFAVYGLQATTLKADGTAEAATNTDNTVITKHSDGTTCQAAGTYVVYGDDFPTVTSSDDGAKDGMASSRDAYKVVSAMISVSKNATTIWDPVNYNGTPKAIPGALVRYVVTISNDAGAGAPATLSTISDTLVASLAMDPDLKVAANDTFANLTAESAPDSGFKVVKPAGRPTNNTKYYTTTGSADGIDLAGQVITATMATVLPNTDAGYSAGELKAGESVTITFNAVVQ